MALRGDAAATGLLRVRSVAAINRRRQRLGLVHFPEQSEQCPGGSWRAVPAGLVARLPYVLTNGLCVCAVPLLQQFAERRVAGIDQVVAPGLRPMLPRGDLTRIMLQCLECLHDRFRVAAPEQLGDELQLAFAGDVRTDAARLFDGGPERFVNG